jgi:glycosyltransferase involved in cell wall biosynthesis
MNQNLKFSIIIPSYNENEDIRLSIESAINQSYSKKEILVVDDSTDNTPAIIKEYEPAGVKLLNGPRKGCCGAKNFGIRAASGEVIVILNSDVVLPPDFLGKILKHYQAGADYVTVESRVFNQENFWARFIEMQHRYKTGKIGEKTEWSEGFSFRRQAGLDVGLIPGDFSARFCRDWFFGKIMGEAGFKKVVDRSILVTHKAPDNFKEYWRVRKTRGRFSALTQYFLLQKPRGFLTLKFLIKDLLWILEFVLVFPAAIKIYKISCFSKNRFRNFFSFFYAYLIQKIAFIIGEWNGLIKRE